MLHNARTSAERQMEGKCNSQVEEITRKSYNKELQATNTGEWFAETKLSSLEIIVTLVQETPFKKKINAHYKKTLQIILDKRGGVNK